MSVLFFLIILQPPGSTLFPYTTLFRSGAGQIVESDRTALGECRRAGDAGPLRTDPRGADGRVVDVDLRLARRDAVGVDRKSTRLNSSHANISYAVFCLKKNINSRNTII